jgi:hypothetical protein
MMSKLVLRVLDKCEFLFMVRLIKRLHKMILEAKALTRKRTEQMTRDELFKLSQDRQKNLKYMQFIVWVFFSCFRPQTAEDKIGEEVTKSLKRMLETMRTEVERSSVNISTAHSTTKQLEGTSENYDKLSGTLDESRNLIRDLWKKNRNDMLYIFGALGIFIATAVWVIVQRTPGVVWLPGKVVLRQLSNLIPKSGEKFAKVAESIFSDNEEDSSDSLPEQEMFIDTIPKSDEDFGNDSLLKEKEEEVEPESSEQLHDPVTEQATLVESIDTSTATANEEILSIDTFEAIATSTATSNEEFVPTDSLEMTATSTVNSNEEFVPTDTIEASKVTIEEETPIVTASPTSEVLKETIDVPDVLITTTAEETGGVVIDATPTEREILPTSTDLTESTIQPIISTKVNEPAVDPVIQLVKEENIASSQVEESVTAPTEEAVITPTKEPVIAHTKEPVITPTEEPVITPTEEPVTAHIKDTVSSIVNEKDSSSIEQDEYSSGTELYSSESSEEKHEL